MPRNGHDPARVATDIANYHNDDMIASPNAGYVTDVPLAVVQLNADHLPQNSDHPGTPIADLPSAGHGYENRADPTGSRWNEILRTNARHVRQRRPRITRGALICAVVNAALAPRPMGTPSPRSA
jgi:hypothetical protein